MMVNGVKMVGEEMITKYHAKYYANLLTQQSIGGDINSLSQSLLNATVDVNPHQIEAALFAFRSPLSKGVILADEVGLGKTIEAGLVLCQYWATGRRKIIVICPASLRKQWSYELTEKFGINSEILDTKNYNQCIRDGKNPFSQKKIIICSYNFAARKRDFIRLHGFDLAVIDEAHKLRNVYKKNSKTARFVKESLENTKKLLLTATPFQNSLMELFGLTSVIDENIFGDSKSFRAEYVHEENNSDLQQRLAPYFKRTLRKDVMEYINYTKRLPITQKFAATDLEQKLYNDVSEFLRRDDIYSVPSKQKTLTTMIIRKILASSTYALIGTLRTVRTRLQKMLEDENCKQIEIEELLDIDELDLLSQDEEDTDDEDTDEGKTDEFNGNKIDKKALTAEIETVGGFIETALKIKHDSKSTALLQALNNAFVQLQNIGAEKKALIFTESTRTQSYLKEYLEQNGYVGKIVIFNGSNSDKESNAIYDDWYKRNAYNGKASGIKAADRRMAIVEYFRDRAEIMIATEAAAEGLNLQFCSLVVNYDLPWNPQRIEQRIGRCHRYGQKSDVVVVNFVNQRNYADMRVFNLLMDKFHLFSDVFGASDEVLGQIEGIDFEKRIWAIYQECRTEKEINDAFEQLQNDMKTEIDSRMNDVKDKVLDTFDIEVQERMKLAKEQTNAFLNRYEHIFWELTKFILLDHAVFDDNSYSFVLMEPIVGCKPCKYDMLSQSSDGIPYRLSHPLAQYVLEKASEINLEQGKVIFSPERTDLKITLPDYMKEASGYLLLSKLDVSAFDQEQYSLFTSYTKDGHFLTQEDCEKLFLCGGSEISLSCSIDETIINKLSVNANQHINGKLSEIDSRNLSFFREEEERIFRWEKDLINGLEHELDIVKLKIREQERLSRTVQTMEEKVAVTKSIDELERIKRKKRNELADREDEIGEKRRKLISDLDSRMIKQTSSKNIFIVEWQVK